MPLIGFYHLTRSTIEQALPRLLSKAFQRDYRILLRTGEPERLDRLDDLLWTFDPKSWLPHAKEDDRFASLQPILLSAGTGNPNKSNMLILTGLAHAPDLEDYERILEVFDGHSEEAVQLARQRWKQAKDHGMTIQYWQENDRGGWTNSA